jgi:uncharacterized protein
MKRENDFSAINLQQLAKENSDLSGRSVLQNMERLRQEIPGSTADLVINWRVTAELRGSAQSPDAQDVWMHLALKTTLELTCQRCMGLVATPIEIDQWYRFVATEEIALAEDDLAEEDLLVGQAQFDLAALVEDELLMALPLVAMHEKCPLIAGAAASQAVAPLEEVEKRPNPFAVLSNFKAKH